MQFSKVLKLFPSIKETAVALGGSPTVDRTFCALGPSAVRV